MKTSSDPLENTGIFLNRNGRQKTLQVKCRKMIRSEWCECGQRVTQEEISSGQNIIRCTTKDRYQLALQDDNDQKIITLLNY